MDWIDHRTAHSLRFNEHLARLIHSGDWILGFIDGQGVWLSDPGDMEACKREMQAEMQSRFASDVALIRRRGMLSP
jgi:hypothetical protein